MRRIFPAALLAAALLTVPACAGDATSSSEPSEGVSSGGSNKSSGGAGENTASTAEATLSDSSGQSTQSSKSPEGTLQQRPENPEVVLRIEGTPNTAFRGLCTVGDRDEVLGGEVPKRFTFDLEGQKIDCRIQKKNSGGGALRVILLDGDRTRSVQSTQSGGGTITLSYSAG